VTKQKNIRCNGYTLTVDIDNWYTYDGNVDHHLQKKAYIIAIKYKKEWYTEDVLMEWETLIDNLKKLLPTYNPVDSNPGGNMDMFEIYFDYGIPCGLIVLMPRHNHRINYLLKKGGAK
jgi:hypothetical protein